jgi:hypothetical protein
MMPEPQRRPADRAAAVQDQPQPHLLAALLQAAEPAQSAQDEATAKRAAKQEAARRRAAEQRAAYRSGAQEREDAQQREAGQQPEAGQEREAAPERLGAHGPAGPRTVAAELPPTVSKELAHSRRLVESSNMAAAVLEADAAFSKATHARLWAYDLPFFHEQAQLERDQYLTRMLAAAGRGLLDALADLFRADALWVRLAASERTLSQEVGARADPFRTRMELAELLTHHLPDVLVSLGYTPPPPAANWTDVVHNSMQVVLAVGQDPAAVAGNAERARQELAFFNQRLRAVVEQAERAQGAGGADMPVQPQLARLRAAISAARDKAVPAALAAGGSAAFAGMAAGPAAMGPTRMAAALPSGSIASLAASATEAAATAMLAEHSPPGIATSAQLARTDLDALDDCVELLRSAGPATLERVCCIVRRGVFQTLQDCAICSFPVRDFLWEWSRAFLRRLDSGELTADDAHVLVNGARLAVTRRAPGQPA